MNQMPTRVLGRFRVVKELATGGMGVVYLGRTEGAAGFRKPVVIKRIVAGQGDDVAEAVAMFAREARILSKLRHPGIVDVVDFGEEAGSHYMVLAYVHGYDLSRWLAWYRRRRKPFPVDLAVLIVVRVLEALEHAHTLRGDHGSVTPVIHRDVTPSNVLVDVEGHVKLADFGIARLDDVEEELTSALVVRGKASYVAPEMLRGGRPTISTDLYSVGVMLHELLRGQNEFRSAVPAETMQRVMDHTPTLLSTVREDVSLDLAAAVLRAMAKSPDDRFPSVRAMHDAILAAHPIDLARAERLLAETAVHDFDGPMAEALALEPLASREEAWKTAPDEPVDPVVRTRRSAWWAVGASIAVALAALAVAVALQERKPRQTFVVVEQTADEPAVQSGAAADAPSPPTETSAPTPAPNDPVGRDGGTTAAQVGGPTSGAVRAAGDDPSALSRAVLRQQPAMRRCVESHAAGVDGSPRFSLRFVVAPSGAPESVTLEPASLAGSPLGACLVEVASRTRFDSRPAPIAFRVPITLAAR